MNYFPKESKYHARKCTYKGKTFDSTKEMQRYIFLLDAEKNGKIANLRCQEEIEILPNQYEEVEVQMKTKTKLVERLLFQKVSYRADFAYVKTDTNEEVLEDVKGLVLDVFKLKQKMLYYLYKKKIRLIHKATEDI